MELQQNRSAYESGLLRRNGAFRSTYRHNPAYLTASHVRRRCPIGRRYIPFQNAGLSAAAIPVRLAPMHMYTYNRAVSFSGLQRGDGQSVSSPSIRRTWFRRDRTTIRTRRHRTCHDRHPYACHSCRRNASVSLFPLRSSRRSAKPMIDEQGEMQHGRQALPQSQRS